MSTKLLGAVITASAIATALLFAMMLPAVFLLGRANSASRLPQGLAGTLIYVVVVFLASVWLFRTLSLSYSAREAKTAAYTFALTSPISMGIAMLLAPLAGSVAQDWFGFNIGRVGILAAIMVGVFSVTAALSYLFVSAALFIRGGSTPPAPPADSSN